MTVKIYFDKRSGARGQKRNLVPLFPVLRDKIAAPVILVRLM